MPSKIEAIEYVFPNRCISNEMLQQEFPDYDFSSFEKKVGIQNRYIVGERETGLDLAIKACEKVFSRVDKKKIDFVLYCTQSPDYYLPTTACILQHKVGLRNNIGALDFNLGCSGYTYGLSVAKALINTNTASNILLITAETYSKYLHPKDRSNRAIFGDAATATVITQNEDENIGEFLFGTDGEGCDKLIVQNGGSKNRINGLAKEKSYGTNNVYTDNHLYMDGPEIMNFTTQTIPMFIEEILLKNGLPKEQISQYVLHQANKFMLGVIRKKLKIPEEKFCIEMADGGNTVSSTIPIALKRYSDSKKVTGKEQVLLAGFGVGLSWCGGSVIIDKSL